MRENAPEETEIVFEVLNIEDPLLSRDLGVCMYDPAPIVGRKGQRLNATLCTESNHHPLPTDRKLAT